MRRRNPQGDPIEDIALLDLLLEAVAHGHRAERVQVCPDFDPRQDSLSMNVQMDAVDNIAQPSVLTVHFEPALGRLTIAIELRDE